MSKLFETTRRWEYVDPFYDCSYSVEGSFNIAPSTHLLLPLIQDKNFNLSASNFDDWLNGNNDIQLLPYYQRILILLQRLCFDNEGRKNFYGSLRRVENIILEADNEKNTRTEDLKTVLPAAVFPWD